MMDIGFNDGGIHAKPAPADDLLRVEPGRHGPVDGGNACRSQSAAPIGQRGRMRQGVRHPEVAELPPVKAVRHLLDEHAIRQLIALFQVKQAQNLGSRDGGPPLNGVEFRKQGRQDRRIP